MSYVKAVFGSDDNAADSIFWATAMILLTMGGIAVFKAITIPGPFDLSGLGTGAAAVIAAGGACRVGREHFCNRGAQ